MMLLPWYIYSDATRSTALGSMYAATVMLGRWATWPRVEFDRRDGHQIVPAWPYRIGERM